jgi:hypothetical protein
VRRSGCRSSAHSQAATTHRYAHLDADPLRRAVDTIGATISAAMEGNKGGQVVPMAKRGGILESIGKERAQKSPRALARVCGVGA